MRNSPAEVGEKHSKRTVILLSTHNDPTELRIPCVAGNASANERFRIRETFLGGDIDPVFYEVDDVI
jgi:hypothetical protein